MVLNQFERWQFHGENGLTVRFTVKQLKPLLVEKAIRAAKHPVSR